MENNVIGTLTIAQAAMKKGISDFALISTDKAVRPTNVRAQANVLRRCVYNFAKDLNLAEQGYCGAI